MVGFGLNCHWYDTPGNPVACTLKETEPFSKTVGTVSGRSRVILGTSFTVRARFFWSVPRLLVTVKVTVKLPETVGVPPMLAPESDRPLGRPVAPYVKFEGFPLAVML